MQELLDFVEQQLTLNMFVGLNTHEVDGVLFYTVDYWETETVTDADGADVEIKAGKQKTFTI